MPLITVETTAFAVIYDNSMTPKCRVYQAFSATEEQPQSISTPYPDCDLFAVSTEHPTIEDAEAASIARAEELGWVFPEEPV